MEGGTDCTGFARSEYCSTVVVVHGAIVVWRLWWWSLSNHMASWSWRGLKNVRLVRPGVG